MDKKHAELIVLGGGPGGYTAAFRAADLGKKVVLIERHPVLGGICLNVGCIPSKALLHVAKVVTEINELKTLGIDLGTKKANAKAIRQWTESVIKKLNAGLKAMAKQRGIEVVHGTGAFSSSNTILIQETQQTLSFDASIIATGSQAAKLATLPDSPKVMDPTSALLLKQIPKQLLIIGGGIIGLEMATIYAAFGSKVTIVEMTKSLIPECDADLTTPLLKTMKGHATDIFTETRVNTVKKTKQTLSVSFEGKKIPERSEFDGILVAIGRRPNIAQIGAEHAGIYINEQGFIHTDDQQRTNVTHIFAIGDVTGQAMLAHKASHEGKVAAEVIAGLKSGFDGRLIPSVAYTDPEIAWVGVTETQAKKQGIAYQKGSFPWAASGRSLTLGRSEGMTKLLFNPDNDRVIGMGVVGPNAGDLIAEGTLAIEMGCDAEDLSLTIHPHPTLSETVGLAAEVFHGSITDLYIPKKNR